MANYYAVKEGIIPGVYNTWEECEKQIKGFSGAKHKKFTNYDDALEFAGIIGDKQISVKKSGIKGKRNKGEISKNEAYPLKPTTIVQFSSLTSKCSTLYAYVDGSFNEVEKVAGYGVVLVQNDQVIFKDLGAFRSMEMNESKNVFGEIRGALKAVELALANDFKDITIVYDYIGIERWAKNEWKAYYTRLIIKYLCKSI